MLLEQNVDSAIRNPPSSVSHTYGNPICYGLQHKYH